MLACSAPVTQGEKPSSTKPSPSRRRSQHRLGQVAAAGRQVRDADRGECCARNQVGQQAFFERARLSLPAIRWQAPVRWVMMKVVVRQAALSRR